MTFAAKYIVGGLITIWLVVAICVEPAFIIFISLCGVGEFDQVPGRFDQPTGNTSPPISCLYPGTFKLLPIIVWGTFAIVCWLLLWRGWNKIAVLFCSSAPIIVLPLLWEWFRWSYFLK